MCRQDVIAQINHARRLAEKLQPVARMVEFHGGHLVTHERTEEVIFLHPFGIGIGGFQPENLPMMQGH